MCGIIGYHSSTREGDHYDLEAALKCLHHRGPDAKGQWRRGKVGLGHTRLAIIDLSGGAQPMHGGSGRWHLTFNGEIYNFRELQNELTAKGEVFDGHSDTEVLLRMIELSGVEKILPRLRGMFAFGAWDSEREELWLARDRMGVKPLVYAETPRGVVFGSEIGALFALDADLSRAADHQALNHYLTFQYIPAPRTGFQAIKKLPPAHYACIKGGKLEKLTRYWRIDPENRSANSFGEACEEVKEKILEATRLRMISDVPLGAFLSGGVDSTITVAAMHELGHKPARTFSIGFEEERLNELPYAREAADHLESSHNEMVVTPDAASVLPEFIRRYGEPMADNSIVPTHAVSAFARKEVTVALTGDGPDETCGGYKRIYDIGRLERLESQGLLPLWREGRRVTVAVENLFRKKKRPPFPSRRSDQALLMDRDDRFKHFVCYFNDEERKAFCTEEFFAKAGEDETSQYFREVRGELTGADAMTQIMYLEMASYQANCILPKVDMASMMNSLECRSPFLDHQFVELAFSLPGEFKLAGRGQGKHVIREAFKSWVPEGFFDRPKMGFTSPVEKWLRGALSGQLQQLLQVEAVLAPICRQEKIDQCIREHLEETASHSKQLWALYVLALWVREFRVEL